ncbi:MAG: transglycosylase SLT domain-containing protein [Acidobacteria bacterium]|nr:transglycosylase SLT domain-containing protein [Acidobacteriota bacterium]
MRPKNFFKKILALASICAIGIAASLCPAAPRPATAVPEPSALQSISKAVLEENSAAQQRLLGEFAEHYIHQIPGTLAHLTLGYAALQGKKYTEARERFEAARRTPTLVQDYAVYYQAVSEAALGNQESAVKLLEGFPGRHPSSTLAYKAVLQLGTSLLALGRSTDVIALLESPPLQISEPDATFLLAQAYQRNGRLKEAVGTYRMIYYSYPVSSQAEDAEKALNQIRVKMGRSYPSATAEMWQTRADTLYAAGRWKDAETAYRTLSTLAEGSLLDRAQVRVSACQYQRGATWPALNGLQKLEVSDPDAAAERLYTMAAAYRRLGRQESMEQQIAQLAKQHPDSEWHEKVLVLAGNYYLLQKEYQRAGDYYRKSYEEFPQGGAAATGHWKVAWQAYRERRWAEAKHLLEEHIKNFPSSAQVPAALYWLGRLVERESAAAAAPYYQKISEAFPNYYYGLLARQRLAGLPPARATSAVPFKTISLDHIQRSIAGPNPGAKASLNEGPYRERVRLLESAWLLDWAIEEMRAVVAKDPTATWAGSEMARLERERGRYHMALRYAKRYVPSYFAQNIPNLSRDVWELLFPRPYWEQLKKQASAAKVDPYLVAGLIRQESEYDPRARSRSNARGLMQLLPSTARMMARRVPDPKARQYQLSSLYVPDINLVYGTFYLKKVLDQFDGTAEYALAGYNAGENRVVEWLRNGPFEEPAEFVESIPFTETREYVQAVLRNAALYRELYPGAQ